MKKPQLYLLAGALLLFATLYWGFDTRPDKQKMIEKSRSLTGQQSDDQTIIDKAKSEIDPKSLTVINGLEQSLEDKNKTPEQKTDLLKQLSGSWYKAGKTAAAAIVAEQIATLSQTDSAWSIAGALYYDGLISTKNDETTRKFCAEKAVKAFESAASLNVTNVEHRVNLALTHAENPPPDNPMMAVLMLRDLESKHPEEASIYNALGRLAIKTNQWERAIDRLEKAWSLNNKNINTPCLLAKAYEGAGNTTKSNEFAKICNQ